ncbi:MFS transporter [Chryseobacterium culicis]|uniref:Drug resistance transporter, Bcr/CflA subfamily n=1 Tax=Chryseobacterium culicis TaxID=680127 RepID=A0A1H6HEN8_CHRCI|nr:MFS transporter [Chryseobacterium culicis]MBE4948477.1 MFS transporter [Chryseobacterium culicis]SEH33572.1 drug resistance transporter, Bcr/CflA subfamily [Chryseobacterium culicis]
MLREASEKRIRLITIMAFVSIPLSGFVTDIYLPSFPSMAKEMMVSEKDIQITLTSYLLSYGISQLFVGGILDSIGRYRPKLIALFLLILTSILITMTNSILLICLLRILQGAAVSVLVVATRAIFVDIYDSERVKHYLSYFTIVWSCGPILAPFLGGYLEKMFNWHANFYFLAGYAGFLFLFEWFFSEESLPQKKKLDLSENISLYKMMLKNRIFMLGIFILGLSYSIVMLFNITGPFIIENTFHFTPVVIGYCTLILGFSWMIGGFIGKRRLTLDFKPRILQPILLQLILIAGLITTSYFAESLFIMIPFAFFIHICSGILFTSFFTTSMLYFPKNAGTAGGLMGGLVYVITSVTSFIISVSGTVTDQTGLSWRYLIIACFLLGIILIMHQAVKKEKAGN